MLYQREAQFSTFEEFNAFPHGWDADFSITSSDRAGVTLAQSVAPGVLLNTARLSCPTLQRGSTPEDMRTFALPLQLPSPYCWRGLPVEAQTLMAFPNDRELFSTMGADAEMLTISIDQALVDTCMEGWEINPADVFDTPRASNLSRAQYARLTRDLSLLSEFMVRYGDHSQFPVLSRGVQEYLVENLLEPVLGSVASQPLEQDLAASRVKAATDYILAHLSDPITVVDVCKAISCNRRSLEQSFRTFAGTSPKQFIQLMRFRHCHLALRAAPKDSTVSHIAGQHGFWHMGHFASSYRKLYAETPSQTLGRSH